jgi:hypothetical protein
LSYIAGLGPALRDFHSGEKKKAARRGECVKPFSSRVHVARAWKERKRRGTVVVSCFDVHSTRSAGLSPGDKSFNINLHGSEPICCAQYVGFMFQPQTRKVRNFLNISFLQFIDKENVERVVEAGHG